MEYIFTNLPRYLQITPQSAFTSSIVQSGHALLFMADSSTLKAKLSDGTYINIGGSGGTDVSDTTAEAANVQSGYYFYNSSGVKTGGTLTVSGGVDVSSTTAEASDVLSGKIFYTSGGVQTSGTIPTVSAAITSGAVVVPSGYIASSQTFPVSSGADVTLGYVSSGVFYELAFSGTSSVEVASSAGLSNYGWNLPSAVPLDSGVVIMSSGTVVSSASGMNNISLSSG